jgi:transporter family-2 protein
VIIFLVSFGLGIASILQGGLNRRLGSELGMLPTTVLNNVVLLAASVLIFAIFKAPGITPYPKQFSWLYLIPGLLGIFLVAGIPYAISKAGAVQVFIPLIASQVFGSFIWDFLIEGKTVSVNGLLGSALAIGGAILASV